MGTVYKKTYIFYDGEDKHECRLLDIFEHTNESLGTALLAKVFYVEKYEIDERIRKAMGIKNTHSIRGVLRYIPASHIKPSEKDCTLPEAEYECMKKYGQYWLENHWYNFVNYDSIKL